MKREDKKVFYDEYIDGTQDYYYMTFGELEDTFGYKKAVKIWNCGYIPDDIIPLSSKTSFSNDEKITDTGIPYNYNLEEVISSYLFDD